MTQHLLDDQPLLVLPTLAKMVGLNESIVLQQLHYWLKKTNHYYDGKPWVYNTYADWQKQFPFWSEMTLRRIFGSLENRNLILVGNYNKNRIDKTKWYTINYEAVTRGMNSQSVQNEQSNSSICTPPPDQNEQNNTRDYTDGNTDINYIPPKITPSKKNAKVKYAEYVQMTPEEYNKLIDRFGLDMTNRMIEVLDNYKGANGRNYKDDYRAILNWVVERVQKNKQTEEPRRTPGKVSDEFIERYGFE